MVNALCFFNVLSDACEAEDEARRKEAEGLALEMMKERKREKEEKRRVAARAVVGLGSDASDDQLEAAQNAKAAAALAAWQRQVPWDACVFSRDSHCCRCCAPFFNLLAVVA